MESSEQVVGNTEHQGIKLFIPTGYYLPQRTKKVAFTVSQAAIERGLVNIISPVAAIPPPFF